MTDWIEEKAARIKKRKDQTEEDRQSGAHEADVLHAGRIANGAEEDANGGEIAVHHATERDVLVGPDVDLVAGGDVGREEG